MIRKENFNLIFELLYEYREYQLREAHLRHLIDNAFPLAGILNEMMTKNLVVYNTTTHHYKYANSKKARDYLKSFTKV